ncbi:hypothetical protein I302_102912 [Kwoniella bestiolae CBS 10118]|uniref:Uncharacterized protein n=1 Tax=Kwoniella bestiolae CBS 10118 TaxID=1296100 RepID=A0A1B9GGA0_9TREE|nr:hypothetical protein I302_01609 [Kwoniella bestiolae CBS 10118]OCF30090.1 hypothetical protein I302_01609 [Kwoniella bestiolae CBS 10118]
MPHSEAVDLMKPESAINSPVPGSTPGVGQLPADTTAGFPATVKGYLICEQSSPRSRYCPFGDTEFNVQMGSPWKVSFDSNGDWMALDHISEEGHQKFYLPGGADEPRNKIIGLLIEKTHSQDASVGELDIPPELRFNPEVSHFDSMVKGTLYYYTNVEDVGEHHEADVIDEDSDVSGMEI